MHTEPQPLTQHAAPTVEYPIAAPLDQLTRRRVRKLLVGYFGEIPCLDRHIALLDTRGAWYAEHALALGDWEAGKPNGFFGLVRHVVRTQIDGPPPTPDIEGWLAAGRPADHDLAGAWDTLREHRYPQQAQDPTSSRDGDPAQRVLQVDEAIRDWPAEHFPAFVGAYAMLEQIIDRNGIVMPPVHS